MGLNGMSRNLKGIQPHEVDEWWPLFWPLLAMAEEYNAGVPIEKEPTLQAIKNGEVQAWACLGADGVELAFTTTIYNTPRGKTLEIAAIGGVGVKDWLWVIDKLAEWGASCGCKRLLATGRKGWTRILKNAGFETVSYTNERLI
jgi:hypothetical protein